jgi:hypothetical protein
MIGELIVFVMIMVFVLWPLSELRARMAELPAVVLFLRH